MSLFKTVILLFVCLFVFQSSNYRKDPEPITFSNFFSPNGDGHNDYFEILNINEFPINKIHIYNRWGDKVYEAEPYKNDWDGTANVKNQILGNRVPDGTYFFRFEYLIGDFQIYKNGKIILMR
jgi:gliding motility-associated-like protein